MATYSQFLFGSHDLHLVLSTNRVNRFVESLGERQRADGPQPGPSAPHLAHKSEPTVDLFDTEALAELGSLEIISRTVVDGLLSGKHRSTHKGGFTEFSQFRPYAPGDDLRMLDWRQYAKSDRYYVRQYDDETNLQALIIADASGSMRFGRSTVTKWDYARMAAACLARVLMRQRDSVGLAVVDDGVREFLKPMPRTSHLARVLDTLSREEAKGGNDEAGALAASITALTPRLTRKGLVMLLSDCFGPIPELRRAVEQFRVRGHDVMVFQVLAPEEVTFPFKRSSKFQDLESSRRLSVQPTEVRRHYLEKFQAFQAELSKSLSDAGCDLVTLQTDGNLGESLASYFRKRASMTAPARRGATA